jgi:hypothetical protein
MFIEESEIKVKQLPNTKLEIDSNDLKRKSSDLFLDLVDFSGNKKLVTQEGIFNITSEQNKKSLDPHNKREQKLYDKMLQNKRERGTFKIEEEIYNVLLKYNHKLLDKEELYNVFSCCISGELNPKHIDVIKEIKNLEGFCIDKPMFERIINKYFEEIGLSGLAEYQEKRLIDYIDPYFGKYTLEALDDILQLRLSDLSKVSDIKTLQGIFFNERSHNISTLINEIVSSNEVTTLVALNLYNKHAVGIIFERTDNNSFQIKYIDPMNKAISTELIQIIKNILANAEIKQISVELQKYANCGAEVIENFILYLTGTRVSQEKAIELHSKLVENKLLGNNQ